MNDWLEITAKTVEDAMIEAAMTLGISSDQLEYEVIEKESAGFLGIINKKPAKIRAKRKKVEPGSTFFAFDRCSPSSLSFLPPHSTCSSVLDAFDSAASI